MAPDPGPRDGVETTNKLVPFDEHPADHESLSSTGLSLTERGGTLLDHEALRQVARNPAQAGWDGLVSQELADADQPVRQGAVDTSASLIWIGGIVRHWADIVRDFDAEVRRIVLERARLLTEHPPIEVPGTTDPRITPQLEQRAAERDAEREQFMDKAITLWKAAYRILLDGRDQVVGMLRDGPTAENIRMLRSQGMIPPLLTGVFEEYASSLSDDIRLMNLNAGGGVGNDILTPRPVGLDSGDIDELAQRIADGEADVATLQEIWQMDVADLERELEEITGDEWDLHFVEAYQNPVRFDGDKQVPVLAVPVHTREPFGNVVAVRRGEGVAYSEEVGTEALHQPDSGSDGRAAISVRVHTTNGGTVDVATAHTDHVGQVADAEQRADQIEQARDLAESTADGGPVIVTGDMNASRAGSSPTADTLNDFVADGYTDAGAAVGPTGSHGHGSPIDFVYTSDQLGVSDPERVQGDSPDHEGEDDDLSDHDGQLVDVSVPVPADATPVRPDEIPDGWDFDEDDDYRPDDNID
jgi:endonuclease/exonuclease/phosphatase family metal-dependent hydrolase